jgi:hypothetical protein
MPDDKPDHVQTSVMLPADLWTRAKQMAAAQRRDLKTLIIEGLTLVVEVHEGRAKILRPTLIPPKGAAPIQVQKRKRNK